MTGVGMKTSPLLGTAMDLLSEGCSYVARRGRCGSPPGGLAGHTCGGGGFDFRRCTDFRIVIGFLLTFEDDIPVHSDRDYEI